MLLSLCACGGAKTEEAPVVETAEEAPAVVETPPAEATPIPVTGRFADMNPDAVPECYHYEPAGFYAMCEEMEVLCAEGKEQEAFELFDAIHQETREMYSQMVISMTRYAENVNDAEADSEYSYAVSLSKELNSLALEAAHLAAVSFGESFREHLGNDLLYERALEFDEVPDGATELLRRESELMNEYTALAAKMNTFSCVYEGKEYNFISLNDSNLWTKLGTDAIYKIYEGCMASYNEACGEVFLEMVKVRTELAGLYGYDSYADYADNEMYARDYDEEDLKDLYAAIKPVAYKYQEIENLTAVNTGYDVATLVEMGEKMVEALPEREQESFRRLVDNGLLVAGHGTKYMDGGFSDALPTKNGSVIYLVMSGMFYDLTTLMHELGHFTDFVTNNFDPIVPQSLDVAETQSTGTEALLIDEYDRIFTEAEAANIKAFELNSMLFCVVYGCIYDEWQRLVYDNPDMTLDEINEAYHRISLEYGRYDSPWLGYDWVNRLHNFTAPMYYVSYGTSAVVAMQIYELSKTDREAALEAWDTILDCGSQSLYMNTVAEAGLIPFTDTEYTIELFSAVADEVLALSETLN